MRTIKRCIALVADLLLFLFVYNLYLRSAGNSSSPVLMLRLAVQVIWGTSPSWSPGACWRSWLRSMSGSGTKRRPLRTSCCRCWSWSRRRGPRQQSASDTPGSTPNDLQHRSGHSPAAPSLITVRQLCVWGLGWGARDDTIWWILHSSWFCFFYGFYLIVLESVNPVFYWSPVRCVLTNLWRVIWGLGWGVLLWLFFLLIKVLVLFKAFLLMQPN